MGGPSDYRDSPSPLVSGFGDLGIGDLGQGLSIIAFKNPKTISLNMTIPVAMILCGNTDSKPHVHCTAKCFSLKDIQKMMLNILFYRVA